MNMGFIMFRDDFYNHCQKFCLIHLSPSASAWNQGKGIEEITFGRW
jgi:hypothetical protein